MPRADSSVARAGRRPRRFKTACGEVPGLEVPRAAANCEHSKRLTRPACEFEGACRAVRPAGDRGQLSNVMMIHHAAGSPALATELMQAMVSISPWPSHRGSQIKPVSGAGESS